MADSTITTDAVVRASSEHVSSELGDEAVVLNLTDGVYYGLNPVSARVMSIITEGPKSVRQICDTLLEEYDVEEDRCMTDLVAVLEKMRTHRLVEVDDA